jgi:hypothetical protein
MIRAHHAVVALAPSPVKRARRAKARVEACFGMQACRFSTESLVARTAFKILGTLFYKIHLHLFHVENKAVYVV